MADLCLTCGGPWTCMLFGWWLSFWELQGVQVIWHCWSSYGVFISLRAFNPSSNTSTRISSSDQCLCVGNYICHSQLFGRISQRAAMLGSVWKHNIASLILWGTVAYPWDAFQTGLLTSGPCSHTWRFLKKGRENELSNFHKDDYELHLNILNYAQCSQHGNCDTGSFWRMEAHSLPVPLWSHDLDCETELALSLIHWTTT
jgi:hypothetical protein